MRILCCEQATEVSFCYYLLKFLRIHIFSAIYSISTDVLFL